MQTASFKIVEIGRMMPRKMVLLICAVIGSVCRFSVPLLLGCLIDALVHDSSGKFTWWQLSMAMIAVEGMAVAFSFGKDRILALSMADLNTNLFMRYWQCVLTIPLEKFASFSPGAWMKKLSYDVRMTGGLFRLAFGSVLGFMVLGTLSFVTVVYAHPASVFVFIGLALVGWLAYLPFKRRIRRTALLSRKGNYLFGDILYGVVRLHPLLKISGLAGKYGPFLRKSATYSSRSEARMQLTMDLHKTTMESIGWIVRGAVIVVCAYAVWQKLISIGEMTACLTLFGLILSDVVGILEYLPSLSAGFESLRAMREVCDTSIEVNSNAASPLASQRQKSVSSIYFRNVSFGYEKCPPLLSGISEEFKNGDFSVIVGRNGTGKSTLTKLILGVVHPSGGSVAVPDCPIGWIQQESSLIRDSVLENIRLHDNVISESAVRRIAEECHLDKWIDSLPMGIHSRISDESVSGGQKQLIVLARALVRNPKILIVDELTNSLDVVVRQQILGVLRANSAGMTVVMITHDLESIVMATRIFHLDALGLHELPKGTTVGELMTILGQQIDSTLTKNKENKK